MQESVTTPVPDSPPAGRNIVICLDGTGNRFGDKDTNVVRLCRVLERDPKRQVLYYDPGVGTMGDARMLTSIGRWFSRVLDSAIGTGVRGNVGEALSFLAHHYQEGDRIYLFGFSRGAYTARALAGLLALYGLPERGEENLFPYTWEMFASAMRDNDALQNQGESNDSEGTGGPFKVAGRFKKTFARRVKVHFVGVWDTVNAVGWFWDPLVLALTRKNWAIEHGRHAISIDEQRAIFRVTDWARSRQTQDLKDVWFAGVHADVGGGYRAARSGLAKISLAWMIREAVAHDLLVNEAARDRVIVEDVGPDPHGPMHDELWPFWWVVEFLPRLRWNSKTRSRRLSMNLFRRRWIRPTTHEKPLVHESVLTRGYKPPNLPPEGQYHVES